MVNNNNKLKKQLYSVKEVADILKISRIAVHKKIKTGRIQANKVGRSYVISKEEVQKLVTLELTDAMKKEIDKALSKVVEEYGEALKLLGKE